ncbi:MAG: zf-HC2 domain-containing protein [Sporolactobacillus sp.]
MMCCDERTYSVLLNKYFDGEATRSEQRQLKKHLADCPACRYHFEQLQASIALLGCLNHPRLPREFTLKVMRQVPAVDAQRVKLWTIRHPVLTTVVVCALPMSVAVFVAGRQFASTTHEKEEQGILLPHMSEEHG